MKTITEQALELCYAIEEAGASEQLTKCSILASDLRQRVAELEKPVSTAAIAERAARMYDVYCQAVGGVAFNGDPLPSSAEFFADPKKEKQATAWIAAASVA